MRNLNGFGPHVMLDLNKCNPEKLDDLHKLAKALLLYETLSGEEIKDLILKNTQPKRATNEDDMHKEESSALGTLGLKPKPAH